MRIFILLLSLVLFIPVFSTAITVSGNSSIYTFNVSCSSTPPVVNCSAQTANFTCQIDNPAFINFVEFKIGGTFYNVTQNVNQFSVELSLSSVNVTANTTISLTQERIHDNNNGFINSFVNASVLRVCVVCAPSTVIIQVCNSTNEEIVNVTYSPNGCSADFEGVNSCTFCSPVFVARTGTIYDCQQNGMKLQYYDDFSSCCSLSPINCLYPGDHDTNISCGFLQNDMNCQYDARPYLQSKINFACTLPASNTTYDCITYVRKQNQSLLIQSNPEYSDVPSFAFWKESEKRQSFTNTGRVVNAYYTDKNFEPSQDFILGMKCSGANGNILTSEYLITPEYKTPTEFTNRLYWIGSNPEYIVIAVFSIIILALFFGFILNKARGR